jgi:hypothetical protein
MKATNNQIFASTWRKDTTRLIFAATWSKESGIETSAGPAFSCMYNLMRDFDDMDWSMEDCYTDCDAIVQSFKNSDNAFAFAVYADSEETAVKILASNIKNFN